MGDELDDLGGDPSGPPLGAARDQAGRPSLPCPGPPRPDGLAVEAEPGRRGLDAVDVHILEYCQATLDLPAVLPADRAVDHWEIPLSGLGLSHPVRGPIPKGILQPYGRKGDCAVRDGPSTTG